GFFQPDAILARNLFGATPADAVSCVSSRIRAFNRLATFVAIGSSQALTVTSRYASSSERGSTSGVTSRKIENTAVDAALYRWKSGLTITRSGQSLTARAIAMAERTPKARAS